MLSLDSYNGDIVWKYSIDNSTFYDISDAASYPLYMVTDLTTTTYYKAVVTNTGCGSVTSNTQTLTVELLNKTNDDTRPDSGLDKAVIIESISFFNITDNRFIWLGEYRPEYPEPWYSEQTVRPEPLLKNHTYLSWNGKWTLTFDVPVFTWIHRVQNLGWIYG